MNGARAAWVWIAAALVLAVTAFAYWPGLGGPFVFDDLPNIVTSPRLRLVSLDAGALGEALFAGYSELPVRGLAHLSFALNHYFSGGAFVPVHIKASNLAIHLCAGLVLFAVARRLARCVAPPGAAPDGDDALALLVMAIWLLHPIALTAVLYAVQRMTSLSALLVLAGVLGYVIGRERLERGARGGGALAVGSVLGGIGVAVLVKENAVLLAPLALLVEAVFFRREGLRRGARVMLLALHGVTVVLPALAVLAVLVWRFDLVEATYASRDFTPVERLLTQARVLFHYLEMFAWPRLSAFGLFHDDFEVSRGLLSPVSTLPAVAAWLAVVVATVHGLFRREAWAFGVAWFLVAHAIESTVIGLEMVYEHRNYLPLAGLTLGIAISVRAFLVRRGVRRRVVVAFAVPMLALLAFLTHTRAEIWSTERGLMEFTATVHPRSYRAAGYQALTRVTVGAPLPEVYASWTRAAKLTRSDHTALVEVIKLLSFELTLLPPDPAPARCQAPGEFPDDMPTHPQCVAQLLTALRAEMHERSRSAPIPPNTLLAYEHLANCSIGATAYCRELHEDLRRWIVASLVGNRIRARLRPKATLLLARLAVASGDTREGLELAEKAARDSGFGPSYTRMLVSLLLALDRPERARAALAQLTSREYWRYGNDAVARELEREIDAHVGRAPAPDRAGARP